MRLLITLIGILTFILCHSLLYADENDPEYCGPPRSLFARCTELPVFKSVVLTVHGWNGSCKTTFGEDKGEYASSVYSLFNEKRFFDFDCFSYDSESFTIDSLVEQLGQHIRELQDDGYEEVLLVTHSTGGILALDYLTRRMEDAVKTGQFDKIKIPSVIAWATPIKGLRWHINSATGWLNFFGVEQNALPQLHDLGAQECVTQRERDGCYLTRLRERLKVYRNQLTQIPPGPKKKYNTYVEFYNGNSDDWVVKPIKTSDLDDGWVWSEPYGRVIDIEQGHLSNIGEPETDEMHRYPLVVIDSKTLINLALKLNLDQVFPTEALSYSEALLPFQMTMADGVSYHAKSARNTNSLEEMIAFWRRIFLDEYPRSKTVDYRVLGDLDSVFGEQLIQENQTYRSISLSFVEEILSKYDSTMLSSTRSPGGGEKMFIETLLYYTKSIYLALIDAPQETPNLEQSKQVLISLILNSLKSPQQGVQEAALSNLSTIAPQIPSNISEEVMLIAKLDQYYSQKSDKLGGLAKEQIGMTILEFAVRGGGVGLEAVKLLNKEVSWGNEIIPVWKSLQNVEIDKEIINNLNLESIQQQRGGEVNVQEEDEWLSEIATIQAGLSVFAGSIGNQKEFVKKGHEQGLSIYKVLPLGQRSKIDSRVIEFSRPEPDKGYFDLQKRYNPAEWSDKINK